MQLGDAVKDFIMDVMDVMAILWLEMSELDTMVKVMIMALGNSSQEGSALERYGKTKILDPRLYVGEQDAQKLDNLLFNMEQYFLTLGMDSEECRLNRTTMFLTDVAKVWWRMKYLEI